MIYIVMGVSGSGKSTIGGRLSQALDVPFYDADDFHPPANIAKMQGGTPLNDDDRRPWLEAIAAEMVKWHAQGDAVLACSALKEAYRTVLEESGVPCQWIFLTGTEQVLAKRLASRKDHFFNIDLLKSQLDTLEAPVEAWKFNIENSVESIVTGIINRTQEEHLKQDIGVVGLGVMGRNLVLNFAENDTSVAAYNRHVEGKEENVARDFVSSNPEFSNIAPFDDLGQFVSSLKEPRNILIMVQAGAAVDAVIDQLRPMLKAGDSIIDGGNSHYLDTVRREEALANDGIDFIGMGVSGGEKGARFGPSMMPGGAPTSVERNLEFFKKVSAKDKHGLPCCANIGTGGAGHFVKMIHNGIEYAEMELIAECYTLLKELGGMSKDEIAAVFESWQEGALESYLLGITIEILRAKNEKQHKLDSVQDYASHKGTGSWSVRAALDLYVAGDTIASALAARQYSSSRSLRHELAEKYQRQGQSNETDIESFIRELRNAYSAARVINHVIG